VLILVAVRPTEVVFEPEEKGVGVEDEVVVAFREAEYWEQRPRPTEMATFKSLPTVQPLMRQGPTAAAIAFWPEPHWQATSLGAQPAAEMADTRHGVAQAGSPERFWAEIRLAAARTRMENFMLEDMY